MKEVIFGRWGKTLRDHRTLDTEIEGEVDGKFPSAEAFPEDLVALMSGKGFLQFEKKFNFVPMIRE